ncbi:uncharacterized protein LOC129742348 [Uranotaenia lowii]|uniref:uncharacterized protein LOC129742348 n=1 Tax=Uranotaenia lowii TaxID=190385 RepID=UPI00247866AC|nr:uncharacterized protein LOC129742348 [Uranotaenia lowii]
MIGHIISRTNLRRQQHNAYGAAIQRDGIQALHLTIAPLTNTLKTNVIFPKQDFCLHCSRQSFCTMGELLFFPTVDGTFCCNWPFPVNPDPDRSSAELIPLAFIKIQNSLHRLASDRTPNEKFKKNQLNRWIINFGCPFLRGISQHRTRSFASETHFSRIREKWNLLFLRCTADGICDIGSQEERILQAKQPDCPAQL